MWDARLAWVLLGFLQKNIATITMNIRCYTNRESLSLPSYYTCEKKLLSGTWLLGVCNKVACQMKWTFTKLQKYNATCQRKLPLECLLTLLRETNTMHLWKRNVVFPTYYVTSEGNGKPCLSSNYPCVRMRAKTIFIFQLLQNSGKKTIC